MKNIPLLFILCLVLINVLCNSCKKNNQNSIAAIFTRNNWQLDNVIVTVSVGDTIKSTDTLNARCDTTQVFTFNTDGSCTYTNFQCRHQPTALGRWALSGDRLYLQSDIVCLDTVKAGPGKSQPFTNAQILTAGQYSLVLVTGDIQNYSATKRRTVMRYGFIREKPVAK